VAQLSAADAACDAANAGSGGGGGAVGLSVADTSSGRTVLHTIEVDGSGAQTLVSSDFLTRTAAPIYR
jgi:hypothetical protein